MLCNRGLKTSKWRDRKKEWIKDKLKDGHVFRKLDARGKLFIEYEPNETAWVPIIGKNFEYIYCLWVAGSFKGKGIGKELLEYANLHGITINFIKIDSLEKAKNPPCVFNNWASFYKRNFILNTILNANSFEKLFK